MRRRTAFALLLVVVGGLAVTVRPAPAGPECVWYSVTAPVVGTQSGRPCSPPLPSPFVRPFSDQRCAYSQVAEVTVCEGESLYTP